VESRESMKEMNYRNLALFLFGKFIIHVNVFSELLLSSEN